MTMVEEQGHLERGDDVLVGHDELGNRLSSAIDGYGVPGAQLGVVAPDSAGRLRYDEVCAGVTNMSIGYPVRDDTLFQIGSISKIWTTVLAMQLVDEGRLSLDAKVHDLLPEFSIRDSPENTAGCTVRQLMNHTSGIEGDAFPDLGRGDDCVERYVRYIGGFPARTPLGGPLSYSNGAFVVLGRIVERLRGMTWDQALQERIVRPAGLRRTWTLPEDVIRFSSALGHVRAIPADRPVFPAPVKPSPVWQLPRCSGPCGSVSASVGDLLAFASLFLAGGVAPNGVRLLSEEACRAMTTETVSLRDQGVENVGWGLGWQLPNWGDEPAYGHGGATEGQRAKIVVFPSRRVIMAVLANSQAGSEMAADLVSSLAKDVGIGAPVGLHVSDEPVDTEEARRVAGTYSRFETEFRMIPGGKSGLTGVFEPDPDDGDAGVRVTVPVRPTREGFFAVRFPRDREATELAFIDGPLGVMYAAMGHRVTPRVSVDTRIPNAV